LTPIQINDHFLVMTGINPSGSCSAICTITVPTP
jgi:hypothetical protein